MTYSMHNYSAMKLRAVGIRPGGVHTRLCVNISQSTCLIFRFKWLYEVQTQFSSDPPPPAKPGMRPEMFIGSCNLSEDSGCTFILTYVYCYFLRNWLAPSILYYFLQITGYHSDSTTCLRRTESRGIEQRDRNKAPVIEEQHGNHKWQQ